MLFFQPAIAIWFSADHATGVAETREIRLEDGSVAWLGADSAISIAYDGGARQVTLLSGEAYFEVEPDAARPFRVLADGVETTVLGTAFDVRADPDAVSVAVNRGRVAVAAAGGDAGAPLEAGDWVRVAPSGRTEHGRAEPDMAGGWRSGLLAVQDRPVAEVAGILARYQGGRILVAGGDLAGRRVTGIYDLNAPLDALQAMAESHGAQVRRISPWLTVVSTW